jgi:hypothetical protein
VSFYLKLVPPAAASWPVSAVRSVDRRRREVNGSLETRDTCEVSRSSNYVLERCAFLQLDARPAHVKSYKKIFRRNTLSGNLSIIAVRKKIIDCKKGNNKVNLICETVIKSNKKARQLQLYDFGRRIKIIHRPTFKPSFVGFLSAASEEYS